MRNLLVATPAFGFMLIFANSIGEALVSQPAGKPGSYDVARPGGKCVLTGRDIPPGEKFMAAVRETAVGLERADVCLEAWKDYPREGLLAFWQSTMPQPNAKKKIFVDDEVLKQIFDKLSDTEEPAKLAFRFVLGLILMRKRIVMYEGTRHEGGKEIWTIRYRGKDDLFDLLNPNLDEQKIVEVTQHLGEVLNEEA